MEKKTCFNCNRRGRYKGEIHCKLTGKLIKTYDQSVPCVNWRVKNNGKG